ncbi:MAG: hypothetical protein BWY15_01596 [Firmicutes bacterium ADurb.Bin193]|nr:MAG: hypothetical protein BWY15_01596 [Firmicutes bacterium ADurb.Bin193]
MSLYSVLMQKDFGLMMADSRSSSIINGEYYAAEDDIRKIHKVDDMLISTAGTIDVVFKVIDSFKSSIDHSLENLQRITISTAQQYIKENQSDTTVDPRHLCFLSIMQYDNKVNEMSLTNINSANNYEIDTHYSNGFLQCFAGVKEGEANSMFDHYRQHPFTSNVVDILRKIYGDLSCEQIGGLLTIYTMFNKDKIKKEIYPIEDSRPIKWIDDEAEASSHICKLSYSNGGEIK